MMFGMCLDFAYQYSRHRLAIHTTIQDLALIVSLAQVHCILRTIIIRYDVRRRENFEQLVDDVLPIVRRTDGVEEIQSLPSVRMMDSTRITTSVLVALFENKIACTTDISNPRIVLNRTEPICISTA